MINVNDDTIPFIAKYFMGLHETCQIINDFDFIDLKSWHNLNYYHGFDLIAVLFV